MTKGLTGILKLLGPNPASWSWSADRFDDRQPRRHQACTHIAPSERTRESRTRPVRRLLTKSWLQINAAIRGAQRQLKWMKPPASKPSSAPLHTKGCSPLPPRSQRGHLALGAGKDMSQGQEDAESSASPDPLPSRRTRCLQGRRVLKQLLFHWMLMESPPEANLAAGVTLVALTLYLLPLKPQCLTSTHFQKERFSGSCCPPATRFNSLSASGQNPSVKETQSWG